MSNDNFKIFAGNNLSDFLNDKSKAIQDEIEDWDEDKILNSEEKYFVDQYYKRYYLKTLSVDSENVKKYLDKKKISGDEFPSGRFDVEPGKEYSVRIAVYCLPFTGNVDLFHYKPSKRILNTYEVYLKDGFICFEIEDFTRNAEDVKSAADTRISFIKNQLKNVNNEVQEYNNNLRSKIRNLYEDRKKRIIDNKKFLESL